MESREVVFAFLIRPLHCVLLLSNPTGTFLWGVLVCEGKCLDGAHANTRALKSTMLKKVELPTEVEPATPGSQLSTC